MSCWQAKVIAAQARNHLAQHPASIDHQRFASSTLDWLDPHGLWSVAPDSPIARDMRRRAAQLLLTLQKPDDDRGCRAAAAIGNTLKKWVDDLRSVFDDSRNSPTATSDPWTTASTIIFEDGPVQRPAQQFAANLGRRSGELESSLGPTGKRIHDTLRQRMFPALSATQWGDAILAAAVRAYVLNVDAHGGWAPLDEETSLYPIELDGSGRTHLWGRMTRTTAGVRVDEQPARPLRVGDVLISIGGVATAGLTVEQLEQLGVLDPNDPQPAREVEFLRRGARNAERTVVAPSPSPPTKPDDAYASVHMTRIPYGAGHVAVLAILDIPDDLGIEMFGLLADAQLRKDLEGVVLDLRGNGGGSIDGAKEALAPFLPGAPLFPMRRRDGSIELEFAPSVAETDRFSGPVAALVDPRTASAAEMIAGALAAYERGKIIGMRTFGKGCAQEYIDDDVGVGVLRLTTLVYALPDGRPVQRVGLHPDIRLDFAGEAEREDAIPNAMAPWRGPDVRWPSMVQAVAWPSHGGRVGPCDDAQVCKALRALGAQRRPSARTK